jgi:hypothetical protein
MKKCSFWAVEVVRGPALARPNLGALVYRMKREETREQKPIDGESGKSEAHKDRIKGPELTKSTSHLQAEALKVRSTPFLFLSTSHISTALNKQGEVHTSFMDPESTNVLTWSTNSVF